MRRGHMKKLFPLSVLMLSLLFLLSSCGSSTGASKEINVQLSEFKFTPMEFTIPAGAEITLNAANKGAVKHEFVIMKYGEKVSPPFDDNDEGNIYWEVEVEPGKTENVTFTAPTDPGEYQVV